MGNTIPEHIVFVPQSQTKAFLSKITQNFRGPCLFLSFTEVLTYLA